MRLLILIDEGCLCIIYSGVTIHGSEIKTAFVNSAVWISVLSETMHLAVFELPLVFVTILECDLAFSLRVFVLKVSLILKPVYYSRYVLLIVKCLYQLLGHFVVLNHIRLDFSFSHPPGFSQISPLTSRTSLREFPLIKISIGKDINPLLYFSLMKLSTHQIPICDIVVGSCIV